MYYIMVYNWSLVDVYSLLEYLERVNSFNDETSQISKKAIAHVLYHLPFETCCLVI